MLYDALRKLILSLQAKNALKPTDARAQSIDWAYGTAVIENPAVTKEMVERAADARVA